jgi:hypothetical protein
LGVGIGKIIQESILSFRLLHDKSLHIHKTGLFQPCLQQFFRWSNAARFSHGIIQGISPANEGVVRCQGAIVTKGVYFNCVSSALGEGCRGKLTIGLRKFNKSTWFHATIDLREHFRPFRDTLGYVAEVDEIEEILMCDQLHMFSCRMPYLPLDMSMLTQHHRPRIYSSEEPCFAGRPGVSCQACSDVEGFFFLSYHFGWSGLYTNKSATPRYLHVQLLYSPEIYTQHFRGRIPLRHIDGPDPSTSTYVKNALGVLPYGRFMKLSL